MKEITYGWYPPARDILKTYDGKPHMDSYTKECMYKHSQSRYADKPGVSTPEDPLQNYRWQASAQQVRRYKAIKRSPSPKRQPSRVQSRSASVIDLEIRGVAKDRATPGEQDVDNSRETPVYVPARPDSGVSRAGSVTSEPPMLGARVTTPSRGTARPVKAWAASTDSFKPDLQEYLRQYNSRNGTPQPPKSCHSSNRYTFVRRSAPTTPVRLDTSDSRERVKSATTYRRRVSPPRRSVMSAGPSRLSEDTAEHPTTASPVDHIQEFELAKDEDEESVDRVDLELLQELPAYKETIYVPPETEEPPNEPGREPLGVDCPKDYDEQLKKYGWRMQVHGDPLNLKRPCIAKRQAFTTKLPDPVIPPNPPKARKENNETFFLNTIPRKPMTFTIHQEWASEVLHAKRMELQKRDGDTYKYRHTDYAFIY